MTSFPHFDAQFSEHDLAKTISRIGLLKLLEELDEWLSHEFIVLDHRENYLRRINVAKCDPDLMTDLEMGKGDVREIQPFRNADFCMEARVATCGSRDADFSADLTGL